VFDENVFPFSQLPSTSPPPTPSTHLLHPDQFDNAAYTPFLLANHGAGKGRGATLELLDDQAEVVDHVDNHSDGDQNDRVHGQLQRHADDATDGFVTPVRPRVSGPSFSPGTLTTAGPLCHDSPVQASTPIAETVQIQTHPNFFWTVSFFLGG
jgi:hypothetical protein